MDYVNFIKALVDNTLDNPRDDIEKNSTYTSPRVSYVSEVRVNTPINDLSNRETTLKRNIEQSSSKDTLEQVGQGKHVGKLISLDPFYSPRAYLNHQHKLKQYDVMHFIHELSPNITFRKDEALDDEDSPSQPNKVDMKSSDEKENFPKTDIPSSSIHPFGPSTCP